MLDVQGTDSPLKPGNQDELTGKTPELNDESVASEKEVVAEVETNETDALVQVIDEKDAAEIPVEEALPPSDEEVSAPSEQKSAPNDTATEDSSEIVAAKKETQEIISPKSEIVSKEDVITKLQSIISQSVDVIKDEVELLKRTFYKLHKAAVEEEKKTFLEKGGDEKDFVPLKDELEEKLKELIAAYKEKKAQLLQNLEKTKEENLKRKEDLIERVKNLVESSEDINKAYNEFKKIQQEWNEITLIPQTKLNEIWRKYQVQVEKFYDLVKINNEFRDYDFKKNLEAKAALCEAAERLDEEPDVISAFYQLQNLHEQWREIGPVAREKREEIWNRFKAASTVINKKHQQHFEALRENENQSLDAKNALCEEIEAIDTSLLKTFKEWNEKTKEVIDLQAKWKTLGFAPRKVNEKIFERFRSACDKFFQQKSEFFKSLKSDLNENFEKKKELADKAESLKESTDWKVTSDILITLQKEWKTIGAVPKKYSEELWRKFIGACDHFFEQKNQNSSSQRSQENENLVRKKEIIEKIRNLDVSLDSEEALTQLRALAKEFSEAGHVPFREKDAVYKEYHAELDKQFDRLNIDKTNRRLTSYKESLRNISESGKSKLFRERDKLYKTYEILKSEIQTYENNIGFLSASSKGANTLISEMERKIEKLKDDLELIAKKIEAVDENLKNQNDNENEKPS